MGTWTIQVEHRVGGRLAELLERLLAWLEGKRREIVVKGGEIMFTLPNDQVNVPFRITGVSAVDAEGEGLAVVESFESDEPGVVGIVFGAEGVRSGELVFGHSGVASLMYKAVAKSGKVEQIVKTAGAQFTITTGAVGVVTGGDLVLEGITED